MDAEKTRSDVGQSHERAKKEKKTGAKGDKRCGGVEINILKKQQACGEGAAKMRQNR